MANFIKNDKIPALWYIEWLDHSHPENPGWKEVDAVQLPVQVISIGWIVGEDDVSLHMINHVDSEDLGHVSGFCIVKSCITKRVKIKDPFDWS